MDVAIDVFARLRVVFGSYKAAADALDIPRGRFYAAARAKTLDKLQMRDLRNMSPALGEMYLERIRREFLP